MAKKVIANPEEAIRELKRILNGFASDDDILELSQNLHSDAEVMIWALKVHSTNAKMVVDELWQDPFFVEKALQETRNSRILEFVSDNLLADPSFLMGAIGMTGGEAMKYASEQLRSDKDFVLGAIKASASISPLEFASGKLRSNKNFILEAISASENGYILEYVSDELRRDKEVVLVCVGLRGMSLKIASDNLKKDREVVKKAVG